MRNTIHHIARNLVTRVTIRIPQPSSSGIDSSASLTATPCVNRVPPESNLPQESFGSMTSLALLTAPSPHHPLPVVSGAEGGGNGSLEAADKQLNGKRKKFQKKTLKRARDEDEVFLTGSETEDEATEPNNKTKKRRKVVNRDQDRKKPRRGKKKGWRKTEDGTAAEKAGGDNSSSDTGNAPFNTTQFLMADHGDTIQYLDEELGVGGASPAPLGAPHNQLQRARQASFSQEDAEDTADIYYSSPDDEGDFLSGEFLRDYNNVRADRLVTMSKSELIGEYISMEARIDSLEKRLERAREREDARREENARNNEEQDEPDYDFERLEFPMSPEVAEKIRVFQREIHGITLENNKLKSENRRLLKAKRRRARDSEAVADDKSGASASESDSDVSSSSDSSSSSSDSSSSDSSEDDDEVSQDPVESNEASVARKVEGPDFSDETAQDTGYESGQSGNLAAATSKTALPTSKLASTPGSENVVTSTS